MANRRRGGIVSMAVLVSIALRASEGVVEAQVPDPNLIVNGSFEQPVVNGLGSFSSIPGWDVVPGSPDFEIQRGIAGSPFEGAQHCELDGFSPTAIFQEVPTTPDRVYQLSFAFSPRPGLPLTDNILRVSWGGIEVTTIAQSGSGLVNTSWSVHTFQVVGGPGATTRLVFEDLGTANTTGTYIDDVRLLERAVVCDVDARLVGSTLNLDLKFSSPEGVRWDVNVYTLLGNFVLFSTPLPNPPQPFNATVPLPNFPPLGEVVFWSGFRTLRGVTCFQSTTIDTGTFGGGITGAQLGELLRDVVPAR